MSRKPNPTLVGAFVLGGIVLTVVAVLLWGSGRLFQKNYKYICYFTGSVNGLSVGAPVKSRGVAIGRVVAMRLRYHQGSDDTRVPVFIELNGSRLQEMGLIEEPTAELLKKLVAEGLRARLESQSLVTGQLYVNLDRFPGAPSAAIDPHSRPPEIPTVPTKMEEAAKSLSGLLDQLKDADLAGTGRALASAVAGLDKLINNPAVASTLSELPSTVASLRQLMKTVDATIDARGPVLTDLQRAIVDVQKAASAVRSFAEFLQRNPNSLLVGRKKQ